MQRKEKAIELFQQQFNCCQSVFTAFRRVDVLDEENALKLTTILGAGVACTGSELCGAVTGGLLAISMHYGRGDIESVEAKRTTYELGRRFMSDFKARMGSCSCQTILGMNIGIAENAKKAREMKLFETKCLDAIVAASDILEELL
jgi:C_GCAxxG_C_C family probable redox protein